MLITSLIFVLITLISITLICFKTNQNKEYVTITFETGEGSNIDDMKVEKGSKVDELPVPTMAGATFDNWYYDDDYVNTFNYDNEINEDLTLYADYLISISDLMVNENIEHYEENCEKTKEVTVIARRGLSKEQFLNNITIEAITGELPKFDVSILNDEYTIIPLKVDGASENGYEPGKLYQITIPSNYRFKDLTSNVTDYKFRIYKDDAMTAEVNKDIKYLLTGELLSFNNEESDTYIFMISNTVFAHHKLEVGDIVSISEKYDRDKNNEIVLDTDNSTVVKITGYKQIGNDYLIEAVQASLGEIFKDVDVSFVNAIPVSEIMATIEEADVANELENSEGVKKMSKKQLHLLVIAQV